MKDAARWVKAINSKYATVEHPSENLRGYLVRKRNEKSKPKAQGQSTSSSNGNIHNNLYFNIPTTPFMSRRPSVFFSPQESPQNRHSTRRIPSTSPARSDPDGRAEVDQYFAWLIKKYPADDERLVSAKDKVHEKGLDLVTLRKIDNLVLDGWGIVWGLADKIKREIKAFQDYELHL